MSDLDRFPAVWILPAMAIGIILSNLVPETTAALEKDQFVGGSVPIGRPSLAYMRDTYVDLSRPAIHDNCRAARDDIPYPIQAPV